MKLTTLLAPCLALALALGLAACQSAPPSLPPAPTEHRLAEGAEAANKAARKAWYAERHGGDPSVDWKAIEASNGAAQVAKRNQLALATKAATPASRWTERGSRNQAGRVHAATHSPDGTKLYVGSSKAGIWRGNLDGSGWEPLGDNLYGGAHWLAVTPGASPGEPDRLLAATDGGSVHHSTDDGATWLVPSGLPSSLSSVRRVLTASDGSYDVYLLARSSSGAKRKLYRSTDGGASFSSIFDLGSYDGDAWIDRTGGIDLYVLHAGGLELTRTQGATWIHQGSLPVTSSRAELCGSEAGAPRFYAVVDTSSGKRMYRSNNAGKAWTYTTDVSDYWGSLNASTTDKDLVAWGGVECWRSTDAGVSFNKVNGWADYYGDPVNRLHADIPGIDVVPGVGGAETWYVSTDGGLFSSDDGLGSVLNRSLDGLRISQYYTTLTSTEDPDHVVAGSQDQGWQWGDQPAPAGEIGYDLDQRISGDYGHAVSGDGTHKYVYSVYPGFVLVHKGESNPTMHQVSFPTGTSYSWLPFLAPDPGHIWRFFFCATHLYRYEKGSGNNWTPTKWSNQSFAQSSGEYLTGLAFDPSHLTRAYAVTNKGKLWWSNDHGVTWAQSSSTGPGPHYFYGTAIVASATPHTVYVGGSGYSGSPVWRSTDGGASFHAWGTGLPSTLVYSLAEAPDGSGAMFAGTETGAYRRDPGGVWVDITGGDAPVNTYWSAEAIAATNTIRFGTYGRGMWDYSVDPACGYAVYGAGLGGANTLLLSSSASAGLGVTHQLDVTGGAPFAPGLVGAGFAQASLPLLGGTLLIDVAGMLSFPILADAAGQASVQIPVPATPSLAGLGVYLQALLVDAGQPAGVSFSNGLEAVLCE